MKNLLVLLFVIFSAFTFAQEQTAVVKTRGTLNENGELIHGEYVKGALVKIKNGHRYLTDKNGKISFVPAKGEYAISKVSYIDDLGEKYQLINFDEWGARNEYSDDEKVVIIANPKTLTKDYLNEKSYFFNILDVNIYYIVAKIDSLEMNNFIAKEYAAEVRKSIEERKWRYIKAFDELALRYATTDFDQLSEFDGEFIHYIRSNQLLKADSMFSSMQVAYNAMNKLNGLQTDTVRDGNVVVKSGEIEHLADFCDKGYQLQLAHFNLDSAAYYLECKANLDMTNNRWQADAAIFIANYALDAEKREIYYNRITKNLKEQDDDEFKVTLLKKLGNIAFDNEEYEIALQTYKVALTVAESLYGLNHIQVAELYEKLGELYHRCEDYKTAIVFYNEALQIYEINLQKEHYRCLSLYQSLIDVYSRLEDYKKAEESDLKYCLAMKEIFGEDSHYSAEIYYKLAKIYFDNQDYAKAIEYYKKVSPIYEKVGGNIDCVIKTCSDVGDYCYWKGDNAEALDLYNKALVIIKEVYQEGSYIFAEVYDNIAGVYYKTGEYEKALEYSLSALEIALDKLGAEDREIADYYLKVGEIYTQLEEYEKALEYSSVALAIEEESEEETLSLARSYESVGYLYYKLNNFNLALEYYDKTVSIKEKSGQEDFPLAELYEHISSIYFDMDDYESARRFNQKDMALREKLLNSNSDGLASSYMRAGLIYCCLKDYETGLQYYKKGVAIFEKTLGEKHPTTAWTYCYLADAYYKLGNTKKSLEYYLRSKDVIEKEVDTDTFWLELLNNLYSYIGLCYSDLENYPKALEYGLKNLEIAPDDVMIMNNCAYYMAEIGKDLSKAEELSKKTIILEPDNYIFLDTYAYISFKQGDYKLAEEYIQKAIANVGDDKSEVFEHYGDILYALGREDEALEYWYKAIEAGGDKEKINIKITNRKHLEK